MIGWIKTHRAIQEHWIFADAEKYRAWMIILFTVNFQRKKVNIKNSVFECGRGESLLSLDSWAVKFGKDWNKSKVRRFLKLLESDSMIVLKSEHKTTRLTVCNYETYQDERNADETKMKRKRNANETQTTPTKEGKEIKELKNGKKLEFDLFWNLYDKKTGKEKCEPKWNRLSLNDQNLILGYIPKYKISQPDKKFRKNPETFLNNKSWNDELISETQNNNSPIKTRINHDSDDFQ